MRSGSSERELGHHGRSLRRRVRVEASLNPTGPDRHRNDIRIRFSVPPDDLLLRLGEYDLATEEESHGYAEKKVQIIATHPNFDHRTFEYDLALLRFLDPVRFQPNIIPICLPEDDNEYLGQYGYVTGWGRLYEGEEDAISDFEFSSIE